MAAKINKTIPKFGKKVSPPSSPMIPIPTKLIDAPIQIIGVASSFSSFTERTRVISGADEMIKLLIPAGT